MKSLAPFSLRSAVSFSQLTAPSRVMQFLCNIFDLSFLKIRSTFNKHLHSLGNLEFFRETIENFITTQPDHPKIINGFFEFPKQIESGLESFFRNSSQDIETLVCNSKQNNLTEMESEQSVCRTCGQKNLSFCDLNHETIRKLRRFVPTLVSFIENRELKTISLIFRK